jgi:hypothetical protein
MSGAHIATAISWSRRPILLFGLKPILPSRPALEMGRRAQPRSMLPQAPEGLGIDRGEHGGTIVAVGMQRCCPHHLG